MYKPVCLIICLLLTVGTTSAQSSTSVFPSVTSTEIFPYDGMMFISNQTDYFFDLLGSAKAIFDAKALKRVYYRDTLGGIVTEWSPRNSYLAIIDGAKPCTFPENEKNLFIFSTQRAEVSQYCIPFAGISVISLQWSPFDDNILAFIGQNKLFNIDTQELLPFSFVAEIDAANIKDYIGYSDFLWDPATQLPVASINLNQSVNRNVQPNLIENSTLEMCATECIPIVDTLSFVEGEVSGWFLRDHWLFWSVALSTSDLPIDIQSRSEIADVVIYITDLQTRSTIELFRFSSLNLPDVAAGSVKYSPDAKIIAINLRDKGLFDEYAPLPTLDPNRKPQYIYGTLLLHLDWPLNSS